MTTNLEADYRTRFEKVLTPTAAALERRIADYVARLERIDRVSARAKCVARFMQKAQKIEHGTTKYAEPLDQIQDQIGARVIVHYLSDVDPVSEEIGKYFKDVERKDLVPESEWEFGYFGKHFIYLLPKEFVPKGSPASLIPRTFELQVKTLFQHAWSEAEHDLDYKPGRRPLTADAKRRLAFTSAQAWGADQIFDELFRDASRTAP